MKEILWALSNISAGNDNHIKSIIVQEGLIDKIKKLMQVDNWTLRRESTFVICNAITTVEDHSILYGLMMDNDYEILKLMIDCLKFANQKDDSEILMELLGAFDATLFLDK